VRFVLNVIWLIFAGIWMAIGYVIAALLMFLLIITIPFGVQALKLAGFALWPFGRSAVKTPGRNPGSTVGNVLWLVLCGWWLALGHVVTAFFQAITIIGLPLAVANVKMIGMTLTPFGREVVPNGQVQRVPPGSSVVGVSADPAHPQLRRGSGT
jgi:uncharacterized membrane protein YccF (DUF307 family)